MIKKLVLILLVLSVAVAVPVSGANTENETPVIADLKVAPSSGSAGTVYVLSVQMTDPQGLGDILKILYQMREGIELIELPLNDDGLEGDLKKGDGIFSGQSAVPKTAARQTHLFEVFVRDKSGHKSNILSYRFTVLEGISI